MYSACRRFVCDSIAVREWNGKTSVENGEKEGKAAVSLSRKERRRLPEIYLVASPFFSATGRTTWKRA